MGTQFQVGLLLSCKCVPRAYLLVVFRNEPFGIMVIEEGMVVTDKSPMLL